MPPHFSPSSNLRWLAAASLATTAAVHIALAPSHLREAPYAGALFIALSAAALTMGFLLLSSNGPLAWAGAATLSVSALVAYIASRSVGLPSLGDDIGDWLNPLGVTAVVSEAATTFIYWRTACSFGSTARAGEGTRGYPEPSQAWPDEASSQP